MASARYEVRVSGRLSEGARGAFCRMDVTSVPPQTIVVGELAGQSDLCDLLALCNAMGLEVVSLQRLPAAAGPQVSPMVGDAAAGIRGDPQPDATPGRAGAKCSRDREAET